MGLFDDGDKFDNIENRVEILPEPEINKIKPNGSNDSGISFEGFMNTMKGGSQNQVVDLSKEEDEQQ